MLLLSHLEAHQIILSCHQVGTGITARHTIRGHVYNYNVNYANLTTKQSVQRRYLIHANGSLYYKTPDIPFPTLIKINPDTLEVGLETPLQEICGKFFFFAHPFRSFLVLQINKQIQANTNPL